ncbi:MAG: hypothetical protein GYB49_15250 [Alphaproteobacteria bacterium]|nr:hypothetical protein [Alphaproteobacteria bacterium]|tara:strand:- start:6089 stop:6388 length:300 start_codon:yes stop_codon:yes gene_type:complete
MTGKTETILKAEAESDYAALKDDIAMLRGDLKSIIEDVRGLAKVKAQDGLEKGKDLADKAGTQFKETRSEVETQIRDNPLAAVGIAFGAGLIIAMMRGK